MKSRYQGFTIIEVMIAVAIVALLMAIALPSYRDYILRGKLVDAHTALADYRVRLEQFYQDNRRYDDGGGNCAVAAPTSKYFTFGCVPGTAPAQTYDITATGVANEGTGGFAYSIDEANARATTVTAPASSNGWSSPTPTNNCWVRAKPNLC